MFGELLFMPADFARGLAQTMSVPPLPARTGMLTKRAMHRIDDYEMVRRRTDHAGLKGKLDCHVFRATGITAYLEAGGTLENAQAMAAHESPRTTRSRSMRWSGLRFEPMVADLTQKPSVVMLSAPTAPSPR